MEVLLNFHIYQKVQCASYNVPNIGKQETTKYEKGIFHKPYSNSNCFDTRLSQSFKLSHFSPTSLYLQLRSSRSVVVQIEIVILFLQFNHHEIKVENTSCFSQRKCNIVKLLLLGSGCSTARYFKCFFSVISGVFSIMQFSNCGKVKVLEVYFLSKKCINLVANIDQEWNTKRRVPHPKTFKNRYKA